MPRVGDHLGNGAKRQERSSGDSHQTGVLYGITALARRTSIVRDIVLVGNDIALRISLNAKRSLFRLNSAGCGSRIIDMVYPQGGICAAG